MRNKYFIHHRESHSTRIGYAVHLVNLYHGGSAYYLFNLYFATDYYQNHRVFRLNFIGVMQNAVKKKMEWEIGMGYI